MKSILALLLVCTAAAFGSGCAAIVMGQIRGKLPPVQAKELSISVNVAGIGGGSITTKDVSTKDGVLTAGEYHEQINTGASSIKIDGKDVAIGELRKRKKEKKK